MNHQFYDLNLVNKIPELVLTITRKPKKMKTKLFNLFYILALVFLSVACEEEDLPNVLGGSQSPAGEEGNTFSVSSYLSGFSGVTASITDLTDGVSTLSYSVNVTNSDYLTMLSSLAGPNISGTTVTGEAEYRFTSEGIESVYDDGKLILVKYDAKVGDIYTAEHNGSTIRREVVAVSTVDDYYWGGILIKTIDVKDTGRNIPGVREVIYKYNHKYYIVGVEVVFEDASTQEIRIYSTN